MSSKAHIGIGCRALESAVSFFVDCGFRIAFLDPHDRAACLETELFEINLFEREGFEGYRNRADPLHVGFQLPDDDALETARRRMSERHPHATAIRRRSDGDRFFSVASPDGLPVEFFCGTHANKRLRYGAGGGRGRRSMKQPYLEVT